MTAPDLPSYFQHKKEWGDRSGLQPITYDRDKKLFTVASKLIKLRDFSFHAVMEAGNEEAEARGVEPFNHKQSGVEVDDLPNHPLLIGPRHLVTTPLFKKYVDGHKHEVIESTTEVIESTFKELYGDDPGVPNGAALGHVGFSTTIDSSGMPYLQTFGNCACLGVIPDDLFRGKLEAGFGAYSPHNNDHPAQSISLIAGLGHIAHLAKTLN